MWDVAAAADRAGAVALERRPAGSDAGPSVGEIPGLRPQLVCPGDVVTAELGTLRGRGVTEQDGKLVATTCGVVEHVNKLLYVRPLKHRYVGSIGDVVVGRILEVQTERWLVDIGASQPATLHLGSISLPGNVQRRRTDEDSLRMKEFFQEGDLISAEVQKIHESGELSLQTRSARYGRLQNGLLAQVPAVYVRRQAQHIVSLPLGVSLVLGNNGWVWISAPPRAGRFETVNFSQTDAGYELVGRDLRERLCRCRNAVLLLGAHGLEVTAEALQLIFEESQRRQLQTSDLLDPRDVGLVEAVVEASQDHGQKIL